MLEALTEAARAPFDPGHRLFVGYLASALLIAVALGWVGGQRTPAGLLRWMFPREVWTHPSTRTDAVFTVLQAVLAPLLGAVTAVWTTSVAVALARALEAQLGAPGWLPWGPATAAALTVSLLAVADFAHWLNHWLHHKVPFLWPLHAVHHSAPVLTPLTLYRRHPLYDVVKKLLEAGVVGVFQGALIYGFAARLDVWSLGGINVLYLVFLAAGSNLRHTHVWWSWGWLDHLFLSPAQHQLHHSDDPAHEGNYGSILAIWDTLAGTRVEARVRPENLRFGLYQGKPHAGVVDALVRPLAEMVRRR